MNKSGILLFCAVAFFSSVLLGNCPDRYKRYVNKKSEVRLKKKEKEKMVEKALSYMGTKYRYAGLSKNGIDCSGLVFLALKEVGVSIPKMADAMAHEGKMIRNIKDLKYGDLVFFENTYKSKNTITHVGIYISNGNMLHASSSRGVSYANIITSSYWKPKFAFGKRF